MNFCPQRANPARISAWSLAILTVKVAVIRGQLVEVFEGRIARRGGSIDSDTTLWQAKPIGPSLSIEVTTATPVAKRPITTQEHGRVESIDRVVNRCCRHLALLVALFHGRGSRLDGPERPR